MSQCARVRVCVRYVDWILVIALVRAASAGARLPRGPTSSSPSVLTPSVPLLFPFRVRRVQGARGKFCSCSRSVTGHPIGDHFAAPNTQPGTAVIYYECFS